MNEEDIISVIKKDEWMMGALRAAKSLELQDWWIFLTLQELMK